MKMNNNRSFYLLIVLFISISLIINRENVYARLESEITTEAYRDLVAYEHVYVKRGYYDNNCLAFAMQDTTCWIWPWNGYPTANQAKNWMQSIGYNTTGSQSVFNNSGASKRIIAYSLGNGITHFSRKYGSSGIKAKWGHHEIFSASTYSPYKNYEYGFPNFYAYKYK